MMKKESYLLKIFIGIVAGIILNIGPMYLVQYVFKWPLFMDTLGSITVAFIFGGVPAIICATVSQFLMFFIEHYISIIVVLYMLSVWAAIGVVCIFRKSIERTDSKITVIFLLFIISILMAFAVSIAGGIVNGIDKYVMRLANIQGEENLATSYFQADLLKSGISSVPAYILSRIPGNLIERPLITLLAFGISVIYQKTVSKLKNA